MIKNKKLIVILSAAILICGVSGCKKNKSSEPEKITFSWWGSQNRADYTLEGVRYFQEKIRKFRLNVLMRPGRIMKKTMTV